MKRSQIGRKNGLKNKTELKRTGIKRGESQVKRSKLNAVSKKRQKENRKRRKLKDKLWPGGIVPRCIVPECADLAEDWHEPLTRARGGPITDPNNVVPTCRHHNDKLTEEPAWGYEFDLLIHEWDSRTLAEQAADRRVKLAGWYADHDEWVAA